jgi:hypothetical protein
MPSMLWCAGSCVVVFVVFVVFGVWRKTAIMKTALMVAEKPSLAASLANILSNGKNSSKKGKILYKVTYISCRNRRRMLETHHGQVRFWKSIPPYNYSRGAYLSH